MQTQEVLLSEMDASVNFVTKGDYPGMIEARYVRRSPDYFIIYLSSQTGCQKACRFCHLTQTGQTAYQDVTLEQYMDQADRVFSHYDQQEQPARSVHFNFMSRGEVFANQLLLNGAGSELIDGLKRRAVQRGLIPRIKFSTIMPKELDQIELADLFPGHNPDIYYSLYSMDPNFRKHWMPKALPAEQSLEKLLRWQQLTRKIPVLHWALIEGENDDEDTIDTICAAVNAIGLRADFNLVRYNPFSDRQGREPEIEVIERVAGQLAAGVPGTKVKIVGRVGYDVKASCGMFVPGPERSKRLLQVME